MILMKFAKKMYFAQNGLKKTKFYMVSSSPLKWIVAWKELPSSNFQIL
jgi:hypothetical protein